MKLTNKEQSKTKAKYSAVASNDDLKNYRQAVAVLIAESVKVPGFRPGKAPTDMILKHADQDKLQNEFLNYAVNDLYSASQKEIPARVVGEPKIAITKFVPFTSLKISIEVPIVTGLKLPKYSELKVDAPKTTISKKLLEDNLKELQKRAAKLTPVKTPIKKGNLAIIDFEAADAKTEQSLPPASAKDFRLIVGDNTLIPGFEDHLIGLGINKSKDFELVFPKDYADKSFAGRRVHFKVTVKEINSVTLPALDDEFAKSVGPFKDFESLKNELKRQLEVEAGRQATIDLENQILNKLAEKTIVEIDDELIQSEVDFLLNNAKKSTLNRGQTWQEFLTSTGQSEEQYLKDLRKAAINRIKGGLAIGEIATNEHLEVSQTELDEHIAHLKSQYSDQTMQDELNDPNNRRELGMRILTEKVLDFIRTSK